MKALILSGGTGTRLRPLTHTGAKQLMPIANKPVLYYALETLRDAGIQEVGIVVGHTHKEIRSAVEDGQRWGLHVTYIVQDAPRGLADAVRIAETFIGHEPFLVYLGDNLIREPLREVVLQFASMGSNALILLSSVPRPEQFGVAELVDGQVVRLIEKPTVTDSNLALVGVYVFDHTIFEAVKSIGLSWRREYEITDAIQYLVDYQYRVSAHVLTGWWKDTGTPHDVVEANRLILDSLESSITGFVDADSSLSGSVVLEPGAQVIRSVVRGPAIIGRHAVIRDAYVGPFTALGNAVQIIGSEIENSVVLAGTRIENVPVRIDGSLIGQDVLLLYNRDYRPHAWSFVLGDHSRADFR